MKKLQITILTLFLGFFSMANIVASERPATPDEELRQKIVKLIGNPDVQHIDRPQREAKVQFIITKDNQVVVLDVDTESEALEQHIKDKLNYEEVNIPGVRKMTTYTIDFTFL